MSAAGNGASVTFDPHWEALYASGRQLNRWPYDHVISFLKRGSSRLDYELTGPVRVLEVGFGAGNNLTAAAAEGFAVAGIEGSESAVAFARRRFAAEGLTGDLVLGDFVDLPWGAGEFDLVIDRLAITHSTPQGAFAAVGEVQRVLRSGGLFLFNAFGQLDDGQGSPVDGLVHYAEKGGSLTGVGGVTLFTETGVRSLFLGENWQLESLQQVVTRGIGGANDFQPNERQSEWRVIVRKVGGAT